MTMKTHISILCLIIGLALISCTQNQAESQQDTPTTTAPAVNMALVQRGITVYKEQYCGICHQLTAANTAGTFGPSHDGVATRAENYLVNENYSGTATTAAEYLRESLLNPEIYIVDGFGASPHQMPAYTFLPDADIDALVYMLLQQPEN